MRTHRFIASLFGVALGLGVLAACGGGTTSTLKVTPASVSLETSAPLAATALAQQPVATSVPAPAGYSQSFAAALVTAAANTTVSIKEGNSNPTGVPALGFATKSGGGTVQTMGKVRPMVSGQNNPIYYDVISPSASITVAGTVSFTQSFPTGTLSTGTNYYLAFYDSTQASPAWQTISGPVTTSDGASLTFSGTVGSFTLQQGEAYGFCVFSVSGSSTPPPSTNQTVAYLSQGTAGILVYTTGGTLQQTININSSDVGLDDSGNMYNNYVPPSPGPSTTIPPSVIQKFPAGSTTASATFTESAPTNPNVSPNGCGVATCFLSTSGAGEMAGVYYTNALNGTDQGNGGFGIALDVWKSGSTGGTPAYTLAADQSGNFTFDVQHDGTIYLSQNTLGVASYLVYAPGSSTPTRTVSETVVPIGNQIGFSPNYMTVGPDGTMYVTEYNLIQPDPLCGLYIYPPNGPEKFVALDSTNGCGADGVDIDAVGNIYVAVDNAGYDSNNSYNPLSDTLNEIEVFAPGGTSVLRRISVSNPVALVADPDGTLFVSSFPVTPATGANATFVVAPGATTATQITSQAETAIVLYNGYQESATSLRRHTSFSAAARAARGGAVSMAKFLKMTHRSHPF
ncbi:MAG TPA: hypothetical protein VGG22_10515 [Candidatus Baltobacteraceae bacterium]|jgi:hypothetical protein